MPRKPDFSGWATKFNILCGDGRTIRPEAFKECDGMTVPLVWGHEHDEPGSVLGHALLSYKPPEGVRMDGFFNKTENGMIAKEAVSNGDVTHLSIYANRLQHAAGTKDVIHGMIREVSLVLAGANPGAVIDNPTLAHSGELYEEEAHIYMDDSDIVVHSELEHADGAASDGDSGKTVQDVLDSMTDEQRKVTEFLVGEALKESGGDDDSAGHSDIQNGGNTEMKKNIFDNDTTVEETGYLSHDEMAEIITEGKKYGSLKESFLAHAEESGNPDYGIKDIEWLFPDFKNLNNPPEFIKRPTDWVSKVMGGVHHVPWTRIKSTFADITEDEARARGYIKGNFKKEEVFSLLKRTTTPCTVYKKQKLDRDDILDITDFDVVAWLKVEMRMMLDEELARAYLIGDGRLASDDDKIPEDHIRPILNEHDLFVLRYSVAGTPGTDEFSKNFVKASVKSRKGYRGSGRPTMYTSEDILSDLLLLEDGIGHRLYKTEAELATAMRVSEIVTVPQFENLKDKDNKDAYAIIVNLTDYSVGADKGGSVNMFDDFDIDYNAQKYLIETRCSAAMTKPFSAIVLRAGTANASEQKSMAEIKADLQ